MHMHIRPFHKHTRALSSCIIHPPPQKNQLPLAPYRRPCILSLVPAAPCLTHICKPWTPLLPGVRNPSRHVLMRTLHLRLSTHDPTQLPQLLLAHNRTYHLPEALQLRPP